MPFLADTKNPIKSFKSNEQPRLTVSEMTAMRMMMMHLVCAEEKSWSRKAKEATDGTQV